MNPNSPSSRDEHHSLAGNSGVARDRPLVLYDGNCGFCRRSLGWLCRNLRPGSQLDMEPYQEAQISEELRSACEEAVHVITPEGRIVRGGRAALFCLRFTRWRRLALVLARPPLVWAVELVYRYVASHRISLSRFVFVHETESSCTPRGLGAKGAQEIPTGASGSGPPAP